MAKAPHVSAEMLREIISYNPQTGEMIWKERLPSTFLDSPQKSAFAKCSAFNKILAGKPALSYKTKSGYLQGNIGGKIVYAHRAAWAIYYGNWPNKIIDHINGNGCDNRIHNLRDTTQTMNMRNVSRLGGKDCAVPGVYKTPSGKWSARLNFRPKNLWLGTFDTMEEAVASRKLAEKVYGFTGRKN